MLLSRPKAALLLALFAAAANAALSVGQPRVRKLLVQMGAKLESSASTESTGPSREHTQ